MMLGDTFTIVSRLSSVLQKPLLLQARWATCVATSKNNGFELLYIISYLSVIIQTGVKVSGLTSSPLVRKPQVSGIVSHIRHHACSRVSYRSYCRLEKKFFFQLPQGSVSDSNIAHRVAEKKCDGRGGFHSWCFSISKQEWWQGSPFTDAYCCVKESFCFIASMTWTRSSAVLNFLIMWLVPESVKNLYKVHGVAEVPLTPRMFHCQEATVKKLLHFFLSGLKPASKQFPRVITLNTT